MVSMATEVVLIKQEVDSDWQGSDNSDYSNKKNVIDCEIKIEEEHSFRIKSEPESENDDNWISDQSRIEKYLNKCSGLEIKPVYNDVNISRAQISDFNASIADHFLALPPPPPHPYHCSLCNKTFARKANLQRHTLTHTKTIHSCHLCQRRFSSAEILEKHVKRHKVTVNGLYPCDMCDKSFKSTSNLNQHKRCHMTIRPYACDICTRSFAFKANLVRHQTNTKCKPPIEKKLVCTICDKVFQKEFLLRSHLRRHDTDKPYKCDLCGLDFKYKTTIVRHLQWHDGHRPYSCSFCPKTFTHSGLLKPHLRVHTGEKPFQCPICFKFFAHKHNMERHKINHGRIKRLVCDICNKKFPRESRLIYHMRTHTNEKFFACTVCDKTFSHKQNIIRHYLRKHPGLSYDGKDTDASVALKVWDKVNHTFKSHIENFKEEEILS